MKNLYKYGMLAVAALAFASCNKEVDTKDVTGTHVVTVRASKDFDTRTAIVEGTDQATYEWSDGDVNYFHIYENGQEAVSKTMTVDEDGLATFTVSFNNTTATSFEYTAKFFKEESSAHNPVVLATQKPTLTSYDPTADILIAQSETLTEAATVLQFALRRVVTINKMALKGLEKGEIINAVELNSSNQNFSAYWIADGKDKDGNFEAEHFSPTGSKKLTLDYSELETAIVGDEGVFNVYFVSAPVTDASFSVKVTTNKNVYERTLNSKLTLVAGQVKRFGIQLGDYGTPISTGTKYKLVEGMDDLYSGATYVIYGAGYVLGEQKTNNRAAVAVTENNGVITIDNSIDAYPVVIEATSSGYTIKDIRNNGYLYNDNTGKNYLLNKETADRYTTWNISISNGVASIKNVENTSRGTMCFNPNTSNNAPLFAAYGTVPNGGTAELALYVDENTCVVLTDPELSFSGDATINVVWDDKDSFVAPTLTKPAELTATYSSSNPKVATVDENSGSITFVGNGTTTITAITPKTDTYKAGSASYSITVTGAPVPKGESPENPFSAAEVVAFVNNLSEDELPTEKEYYISGTIARIPEGGEFGTKYGNATFFIGEGDDEFEAYRVLYVGNKKWTASDPQIGLGDEVLICSRLTVFGETIETYAVTGEDAYNGYLVSHTKAPYFTAEVTDNTIAYTGGNSITLKVKANVAWTASIDNSASLKIGDATAAASVSGTTDTDVTVIIPENEDGATYTISFSTTSDKVSAPENIEIEQANNSVQAKTYTFTISSADFNSTSYDANNNEKTTTATATDESGATLDIKWTSNQVMKGTGDNSSYMQWQKSKGYIYNSSDLGTIKSVTVNSSTGSFTTYYGTSQHPTSGTTVGDGYFTVKVGSATGYTSSIVIVFEK